MMMGGIYIFVCFRLNEEELEAMDYFQGKPPAKVSTPTPRLYYLKYIALFEQEGASMKKNRFPQ